jgi:hypothetical protein
MSILSVSNLLRKLVIVELQVGVKVVQLYSPKTKKATEDRSKKEVGNKTGVETRKLQAVNP